MTFPLIIGFLVRLAFLGKHAFWFDEKASVHVASQAMPFFFQVAASDTHPPFYFLLLKLWFLMSSDVIFARLLSLVFGTASLFIAYKLFRMVANQKVASFATVLLALSPLHIYYSTQIRMYSLLVFETLSLVWYVLNFLKKRQNAYLFSIILVGIASVYTHYYAFLVILSVNVLFFMKNKNRSRIKPWMFAQLAILAAWMPWFLFALKFPKPACWCFSPIIGVPVTFTSFIVGGVGLVTIKDILSFAPAYILWFFAISIFFLHWLFFVGLKKAISTPMGPAVVLLGTPIAIAATVGLFAPIFSPRALIFTSPFFYLIVARGIYSAKDTKLTHVIQCIVLIVFVIINILEFAHPFFSQPLPIKNYLL